VGPWRGWWNGERRKPQPPRAHPRNIDSYEREYSSNRILRCEEAKMTGIYCIEIGSKLYVGSSQDIKKRWVEHYNALMSGRHYNLKLQRSWNKHGPGEFVVIETCDIESLIEREQFWIDELDCVKEGLNISPTAGSPRGMKRSKEAIEKARQTFMNMSPERKAEISKKLSEKLRGRKRNEETRARMSEAQRRPRVISEETREKMREANRNRSEETCRKLSEAARNRSQETIEKMRASLRGKKQSEETVRKRAESLRATLARKRAERALKEEEVLPEEVIS
jgi:group I intron endonuclease